jgi:hypothetical protein
MSLWKNIDHVSGNGKPLFANTCNLWSSSTTHGATANGIGVYGSVYGVSVTEAPRQKGVVHPGWVSQKVHTGGIARIDIVSGGTGINVASDLLFTDTSAVPGTGATATFAIANVRNTAQAFSTNSAWNVINSITITRGGTGYSNNTTLTARANVANSTPATFAITLGGRAGRIQYETLVAMGSISGDDPKDNAWFSGV